MGEINMFNKFPVNPVRNGREYRSVAAGYDAVLAKCAECLDAKRRAPGSAVQVVAVDGTNGADFSLFADKWSAFFERSQVRTLTIRTDAFVRTEEELRRHFRDNITDNRAFGYMTEEEIDAYFTEDARSRFSSDLREMSARTGGERAVALVIGPGAHWLTGGTGDLNVFLDISRENQQILHRRSLCNFGFSRNEDALEKYKIAFFVEWPILETYRKRHLREFDLYVDMNNPVSPAAVSTEELQDIVKDIARHPMRVKPFFTPGVWGGQYLKQLAGLPEDWVNCAWSFEPIAPENSILIDVGGTVIEIPFLIVMDTDHMSVLGERVAGLFGDYFPIRFDYLDTMDGSNLSVQVHPKQPYIREKFNYVLEQQESYYIMEKKAGSKVYLGLTETCDKESFLGAVMHAQETGEPIPFTDYVQEWDCEKGDLFLIPTGTVHCSGKDNLVLEISSTTWWFTFKIYDYVRKDLDGKPRPINIDHAEANIDWHKKPDWVRENLIAKPVLIRTQGSNEEYRLGQRPDLLFYVNRVHLADRWRDDTNGELLLINLVEGERIRVQSVARPEVAVELGYAESYILPAVFGEFEIINTGSTACKIIKAGVSPEWDVKIFHE